MSILDTVKDNLSTMEAHTAFIKELAEKHADQLQKLGMSQEEIDKAVESVSNFDFTNLDSIPSDDIHAKFRSAVSHIIKALENGKTTEEAHDLFRRVMAGEGKCSACKEE